MQSITHHLPHADWCLDMSNVYLGMQCHPCFLYSSFIAVHGDVSYRLSFWPSQVRCPSCVPSQLLAHPQPIHWMGVGREQRVSGGKKSKSWCSASTGQQLPKHCSVINTVLTTNPKYSTIWAAIKKANSWPVQIKIFNLIFFFSIKNHSQRAILWEKSSFSSGLIIVVHIRNHSVFLPVHFKLLLSFG